MAELTSDSIPDRGSSGGQSLVERWASLWQGKEIPNLDHFLAHSQLESLEELVMILRFDQRQRWARGENITVEQYLSRFPQLKTNAAYLVDLILSEYLLDEKSGEIPEVEDYLRRFPVHAQTLRAQIELHKALGQTRERERNNRTSEGKTPPREGTFAEDTRESESRQEGEMARNAPRERLRNLPAEFGRYRLEKLLGRGGMGEVFLARDTQLGRLIALKIPRFREEIDPRQLERFYREARIAAGFVYPHLCPVYDVGELDGVHYLTMPFLEGESLAARLKRIGAMPAAEVIPLVIEIARALQVAHEAGVIHRDLKPANIMIDAKAEPVVMDFGLAFQGGKEEVRITGSGVLLGTPAYLSPEQILGGPRAGGVGGDIFALGVILYEMITGRLPFPGAFPEILGQILHQQPLPPSQLCPDFDPALEAICLKALAREEVERFSSMAEFARALEELPMARPISATPGTPLLQPPSRAMNANTPTLPRQRQAVVSGKSRSRSRYLFLILLPVLAMAFLGGWFLLHPEGKGPPANDPLPAASRWEGVFRFRNIDYPPGDVEVQISQREGEQFKGYYRTEKGNFEWAIEGTLKGDKIQWEFTKAVRDNPYGTLVGKAHVEGTLRGEKMEVLFHKRDDRSQADMTLYLKK